MEIKNSWILLLGTNLSLIQVKHLHLSDQRILPGTFKLQLLQSQIIYSRKKHLKVDDISFVEETRDLDGDGATFVRINFAKNSSDIPFSFAPGPSTSSIRYLAHHGLRIDSLLSKIIKVMDSPAPAISLLKQKMTNPQNQIAKRMKCNRSANYRTQIQLLLCLVSFSFCWDLIDVTLASEDSRNLSCRQFLTANGCQQCCWCRNKTTAMLSPKSDSLHLSPIQC